MSTRAPASLRASGFFNSAKQAGEKEEEEEGGGGGGGGGGEEAPAVAAAASTSAAADANAESPEGAAAAAATTTADSSLSCSSPPHPPRPKAEARDAALIRLHAAACHRSWAELPDLARDALAAGCDQPELRATLRHLVICAGYAGSLAATSALSEAKLLGPATPGKVGGPPSDAFGLIYGREGSELVAKRLHRLDPVLARRLRQNVYGDLYADAGLPLATRQLLMVSFLGEAGMQDELFGHAQAALLAGSSPRELVAAAEAGFRAAAAAAAAAAGAGEGAEAPAQAAPLCSPRRRNYRATMATLEAAWARHRERFPGAAAAVKGREKERREKKKEGESDSSSSSSSPATSSSSLLPPVLVAGHDAAWWNCVPELDLDDFELGCKRAPKGTGK